MWKIIKALIAALFGLEPKPTQPSTTDLAAQAATATATLQQEKSANDVLQEGAAARAAADSVVVHDVASPPDPGATAALKRDFPKDFRD